MGILQQQIITTTAATTKPKTIGLRGIYSPIGVWVVWLFRKYHIEKKIAYKLLLCVAQDDEGLAMGEGSNELMKQ